MKKMPKTIQKIEQDHGKLSKQTMDRAKEDAHEDEDQDDEDHEDEDRGDEDHGEDEFVSPEDK